ncbi:hypothetical protein C806_00933 [Lachnospiraceae bacterium 3-1]|nr:hypothetical protein C806_00933 [Lachnospiraceae bacterium 3-1]
MKLCSTRFLDIYWKRPKEKFQNYIGKEWCTMKRGKGKADKKAMKFAECKVKKGKWAAEYDGTIYGGCVVNCDVQNKSYQKHFNDMDISKTDFY